MVEMLWWLLGGGALAGVVFAVRTAVPKIRARQLDAAELARRADEQHRWTIHGDNRGVYGSTGAQALRDISPAPPKLKHPDDTSQDLREFAALAYTAEDLATLLKQKPPCWRWAVFASVLVQRRAPLQARLHDSALGFAMPSGAPPMTARQMVGFVAELMEELVVLVDEAETLMETPAFAKVFGDPGDESTADDDGIVHTAHRLMDYHDRFLELSERCRAASAPSRYRDLLKDCARLADAPLQGYSTFVDDFVARVAEMPEVLRYASGTVAMDPVVLHMDVDDALLKRIGGQVNTIASE